MKPAEDREVVLFREALQRAEGPEREAFLDGACLGNPQRRALLEALLQAEESHEPVPGSLMPPPGNATVVVAPEECPGTLIGRYKILEKIGEGGFGTVYVAEQREPVKRRVALKIIKLGMDTKQVIARFEAERQALALMDHPNIAKVFDAGAIGAEGAESRISNLNSEILPGRPYFVMELVRGIRITDYCDQNSLSTHDRLALCIQVCHAIQHAHQKGIIHRDIKPSNILVTVNDPGSPGVPIVIDFGIAKATSQSRLTDKTLYTAFEQFVGTPAYMSPEQAEMSGLDVDTRGDIYSLGVLLYELLTGKTPFDAKTLLVAGMDEMRRIIREQEPVLAAPPGLAYRTRKFWRRHRSQVTTTAVVTVLLLGLVTTAWSYRRSTQAQRLQWAKKMALPEIVNLVGQQDYDAAFSLAQQAKAIIPADPVLAELWPRIAQEYSVATTPAEAAIFCRRYAATNAPWRYLGTSPLNHMTLPRGPYRWRIQKQGFQTHQCVLDHSFDVRLQASVTADQMVWVERFTVNVPAGANGQSRAIEVPAFLIDKREVTNEKFKEFMDAGGYENPEFWEGLEYIKDGQQLSVKEALAEFRDQTGRPGPATWFDGACPAGRAQHPVSGVSWFEAMAYARFVGKSLPSVYHWEEAACLNETGVIVPFSNFGLEGTAPVGSHPGMGHTGLFDMAGNVKEWCLNATDGSASLRYILGGGWGEQTYLFTERDFQSPWNRAAVNGFRCMRHEEGQTSMVAALGAPVPRPTAARDYSTARECSDAEYAIIRRQFEYDRTPLNAVVEVLEEPSPFWSRNEKITFDAAYGDERVTAYFFVPNSAQAPYQAVVYWPGSGATREKSFQGLPETHVTQWILASGRALLFPVYKGTYERGFGEVPVPDARPRAFSEWTIQACKDLCRCLDYLETRRDIDTNRLAYFGSSAGAALGPIVLAVENRFKAAILLSGGIPASAASDVALQIPALDPLHHAPRVQTPLLMINGETDPIFPVETSQRPLFRLLGKRAADLPKKHRLYPGGHGLLGLFGKQIQNDIRDWLDRHLGPVE